MSEKRSRHMIEKVGIDYQERRSHQRAQKMLSGYLSYGDDDRLADCVILDISAGGAKVKFDSPLDDAEGVNLSFGHRLKIAAAIDFPVEVVWQDGSVVGLRFQSLLPDRQRALVERLRLRIVALGFVESRQVVEARGHVGMLGPLWLDAPSIPALR